MIERTEHTTAGTPEPTVIHQPEHADLGAFHDRVGALTPRMQERDCASFEVPASGIEMGYWEGTPGEFPAKRDGYSEMCHIIYGHATVHTDGGTPVELRAGDSIAFPSGWVGRWELHEATRKLYIIVNDRDD